MKQRGTLGKIILNSLLTLVMIVITFIGIALGTGMTAHAEDNNYLTFTGTKAFTIKAPKRWNGTLYYSKDANNWTEWDGSEIYSADSGNYVLYLRGTGNSIITGSPDDDVYSWKIASEGTVACSGDIRSLLDYNDLNNTTMQNCCFIYMFEGCTSLTQAPSLPATNLANYCYEDMFYGCTSLTKRHPCQPPLLQIIVMMVCFTHVQA